MTGRRKVRQLLLSDFGVNGCNWDVKSEWRFCGEAPLYVEGVHFHLRGCICGLGGSFQLTPTFCAMDSLIKPCFNLLTPFSIFSKPTILADPEYFFMRTSLELCRLTISVQCWMPLQSVLRMCRGKIIDTNSDSRSSCCFMECSVKIIISANRAA